MSGLFNPFAEQETAQDRGFSFYSDPLAAYTSAPRTGPGPRPPGPAPAPGPPAASGRGRGPPAAALQQPIYGRGGGGRGGGGRWSGGPVTPQGMQPQGGYDHPQTQGWGHQGGWEPKPQPHSYSHPLPPQPSPSFGAGYPGPAGRSYYGGGPASGGRGGWPHGGGGGAVRPNKWVRTQEPIAAAAAAAAPGPPAVPVGGRGQPYPGRGEGGGGGGRGGGRGRGRVGRGGGRGGYAEDISEVTPGSMQAYYKASFSADPWVALMPRPLLPSAPGLGGGPVGRHASVDMRRLGGASLAEVMAVGDAEEEALEQAAGGLAGFGGNGDDGESAPGAEAEEVAEVSGDEPLEDGDEVEEQGEGLEADEGRCRSEGAQDRPWH